MVVGQGGVPRSNCATLSLPCASDLTRRHSRRRAESNIQDVSAIRSPKIITFGGSRTTTGMSCPCVPNFFQMILITPQNTTKNLAIWLGSVEQHCHFETHHLFSVARRIKVVYQNLLLLCHYLSLVVRRKSRTWMEAGLPYVWRRACLCRVTHVPVHHACAPSGGGPEHGSACDAVFSASCSVARRARRKSRCWCRL